MKPVIVVSAINFTGGGPLSILQDCLSELQNNFLNTYKVVALVHDKALFQQLDGIEFIEFPVSVKSYLFRFYFEYYYFYKLSKRLNPYLWLSLHDVTPWVSADIRAVYCHNPAPFYDLSINQSFLDPTFTLFNLFYRYIYKINIKKNNYVIVQQNWIRNNFKQLYGVDPVIVAYPDIKPVKIKEMQQSIDKYQFFFPTLSRFFKNIEVLIDAVKVLNQRGTKNFEVVVTVDGSENKYARQIAKRCGGLVNIKLIGRVSREEVFKLYSQCHSLVFPSKLETWGLPITEFKQFDKPMLLANLPYAHETVGNYQKVNFFEPDNPSQLADLMQDLINNNAVFSAVECSQVESPFTQSWEALLNLILTKNGANHQ